MRWAAATDWVAKREDAEDALLGLWARATGGERPAATASRVGAAVEEGAAVVVGEAGGFLQGTAKEARDKGVSIWEQGFRKGQELAEQARSAVGVAEEKAAEKKVEWEGKVRETDAEKVIQHRYAPPEVVLDRSAEEILEDRYKPAVDQFSVKAPGV